MCINSALSEYRPTEHGEYCGDKPSSADKKIITDRNDTELNWATNIM